ncbi:MAG: GNAT family N-acetyltransferase [Methanobrevibacter sp.]|uniref:GNAT family N-acetyltransferase n=1 Tax=uncultured Methanobrevibacter sp. TaxID=253161 RepID=UPI0025FC76F0|nr:GNAT family N-acetyltransferase [uncultured Methanobrevibacter sp.]MEE1129598.1 GNAT family N-acetyltransferase [Methanobrevibacter sp.]
MILKTENLILRPWEEGDAEYLYHFAKNPKIGPIAGWPPHESVEFSLNIINTVFSKKETYAITLNEIPIGCISLLIHPDGNHYWGDGSGELGYWIAEDYWGQGLVVEASKTLIEHAFKDLNLNQIYATYRIENTQSKRVLEKLGFKYYTELDNINYLGETFREIAMILEK